MSENKISTGTSMWMSKSRSLLEVCFVCQPADGITVPLVLKWWGDKLERKSSGGGEGKSWRSAPQP